MTYRNLELIAAVSDRDGPVTDDYPPVSHPAIERRLVHAERTSPPAGSGTPGRR